MVCDGVSTEGPGSVMLYGSSVSTAGIGAWKICMCRLWFGRD